MGEANCFAIVCTPALLDSCTPTKQDYEQESIYQASYGGDDSRD